MRRFEPTWLGLATLGTLVFGCTDDKQDDDEVGETSEGTSDESGTSEDESGDSGDTTESTTEESTDAADESTDTTDESDTTETTGDGDFELIAAAFADDFGTLVLTFNDAVGPVDGVEPSDFRISMSPTIMYEYMGMSYDITYYADPNVYLEEMPIGMVAIANGPDPDQLSLTLDPPFNVEACAVLEQLLTDIPPGATSEGHFFPHYAPGDIPVTSEGGSELAPIGPEWVLEPEPYSYVEEAFWPNLDPQVPIPCR